MSLIWIVKSSLETVKRGHALEGWTEWECGRSVLVDEFGELHGDLESWSHGFKHRFLLHLGFFLPCANLSQGDRGCGRISSFPISAGMKANTLPFEGHLALPTPGSRCWR